MTIIEAIKSGERFRRKLAVENWRGNPPGANTDSPFKGYSDSFNYCDIIADDWEIEEKKVTITRQSFLKAYSEAQRIDDVPLSTGTPRLHLLMKELGLE